MTVNISTLVATTTALLNEYYHDTKLSSMYAWWLIEHITGHSRSVLLAQCHIDWASEKQKSLEGCIEALVNQHKPISYILGSVPFGDITLRVQPPTLIPRPETEEWTLQLINSLKKNGIRTFSVLDLCTGTGCIALSLAHAFPHAFVYATDISTAALELASANAAHNAITNITFIPSDLFASIPPLEFDLILSNPPYIPEQEWQNLDKSVREWEDKKALIAGDNGLMLIKKIIQQAAVWINPATLPAPAPHLALEIDSTQAKAVSEYMIAQGYRDVTIKRDAYGKDRLVQGRRDVGPLRKTNQTPYNCA